MFSQLFTARAFDWWVAWPPTSNQHERCKNKKTSCPEQLVFVFFQRSCWLEVGGQATQQGTRGEKNENKLSRAARFPYFSPRVPLIGGSLGRQLPTSTSVEKYENELLRAARFRIFSTLVLVGSWRPNARLAARLIQPTPQRGAMIPGGRSQEQEVGKGLIQPAPAAQKARVHWNSCSYFSQRAVKNTHHHTGPYFFDARVVECALTRNQPCER